MVAARLPHHSEFPREPHACPASPRYPLITAVADRERVCPPPLTLHGQDDASVSHGCCRRPGYPGRGRRCFHCRVRTFLSRNSPVPSIAPPFVCVAVFDQVCLPGPVEGKNGVCGRGAGRLQHWMLRRRDAEMPGHTDRKLFPARSIPPRPPDPRSIPRRGMISSLPSARPARSAAPALR